MTSNPADQKNYLKIMGDLSTNDCATPVVISISSNKEGSYCAITYSNTREIFQEFSLDQIREFNRYSDELSKLVTLHYVENLNSESSDAKSLCFEFESEHSEIQDDKWVAVPKSKLGFFKLRSFTDKRLILGVCNGNNEPSLQPLQIKRCLGAFICYGRYRKSEEMTPLVIDSNCHSIQDSQNLITGSEFATTAGWGHKEPELKQFNEITDKNSFIFFTIRVNLLFEYLSTPVTFGFVGMAKIHPSNESFWLPGDKRPLSLPVNLVLKDSIDSDGSIHVDKFDLQSICFPKHFSNSFSFSIGILDILKAVNESECDEKRSSVVSTDEDSISSPSLPKADPETVSVVSTNSYEEHVTSGSGFVNRDISSNELIKAWCFLIKDWQSALKEQESLSKIQVQAKKQGVLAKIGIPSSPIHPLNQGPYLDYLSFKLIRKVRDLVSRGIPETLRTEVWLLITDSASEHKNKMEAYRILLPKYYEHDSLILKDLERTYPAHDYFQQKKGQDSLYQVNHAYALYDEELGYYQSTSFIAAALLLHTPEEQAFSLLVDIMFRYNHRSLFLNSFRGLHLMLFQLDCLLKDTLPSLYKHFQDLNIESHMYASQWIMTLFTAKFPLHLAFSILDLYFLEGRLFIFKILLALLTASENNLKGLNFEGSMRYFSHNIPLRYLDNQIADELIKSACNIKISISKLDKYEKNWNRTQDEQTQAIQDPVKALVKENKALLFKIDRLEKENASLARGVIERQVSFNSELETLDTKSRLQTDEITNLKQELDLKSEEISHWNRQVAKFKEMLRQSTEENCVLEKLRNDQMIESRKIVQNLALNLWGYDEERLPATLIPSGLLKDIFKYEELHKSLDKYVNDWKDQLIEIDSDHAKDGNRSNQSFTCDPLDPLQTANEKVRNLEIELAKVKLSLAEVKSSHTVLQNHCSQLKTNNENLQSELAKLTTNNNFQLTSQSKSGWWQRTLNRL